MNQETTVTVIDNIADLSAYKIQFSVPQYMVTLVLPKCVMVHGEILSSVYLQIALNINHQKNVEKWKRNACWMRSKVIAANTGYNVRSVNAAIDKLEELRLIKVTLNASKLKVIRLQNNMLKTTIELEHFNKMLDNALLAGANKTKTAKIISSFSELEDIIEFKNPYSLSRLTKSTWFPDINLLRDWVTQAEQIYKGSSLFFINHIAPQIFDYIGFSRDNALRCMSEYQRAVSVGSSQSTMNRYIDAYLKAGCITTSKSGINTPTELCLNKAFLKDSQNIEKRVVVSTMTNEKIICPICQKDFADIRSLSVHLSKTNDKKHALLNNLKKQTKSNDLHALYTEYKDDFDEIDKIEEPVVEKQKPVDEYLKIDCKCNMSCKECYRNWKLDYFDDCNQERKIAFIQEYSIQEAKIEKPAVKEEQDNKDITVVKKDFEVIKTTKTSRKGPGKDTAPGLVNYFYNMTKGVSPNYRKECAQVKRAMDMGVDAEGVRITMDFLHRKGNIDLRFFNSSIPEAMLERKLLEETTKEGTEAFLVKMYYDGMGLPLNVSTLVKDVQRIKETINTGIDYDQTKAVVQYMIDVKCPTLNFIINKRNEALAKKAVGAVAFNQNPCFFDRDGLHYAVEDLKEASRKLTDIRADYGEEVIVLAKKMFRENKFAERFTHFEWAWKIGLELDLDMYKIAKENRKDKQFRIDTVLNETEDQDRKVKILKFREKFYNWLNEQQVLFEEAQ